jgi:large subunit ribosomal protein L18
MKVVTKKDYRRRRHLRLRRKVQGTSARPRMSVYVSNRHLYVQFIDDAAGSTLAAASTQTEGLGVPEGKKNVDVAKKLGALAARVAQDKGIREVVFDRGGFNFTGRIKALADAAREAGLKF